MAKHALSKVAEYNAHGGPSAGGMGDDGHPKSQTTPGRFIIHSIAKHVSYGKYAAWSGVAWGTPVRRSGDITEVRIHGRWTKLTSVNNEWAKAAKDQKALTESIQKYYTDMYQTNAFPDKWVFNDFGHITVKYFRDLNQNGKKDGNERVLGDFIHTTPYDEALTVMKKPIELAESHGCIHVRPHEIDILIKVGYLKRGNVIEVHPYSDALIKNTLWRNSFTSKFEVHFFPKLFKLVVYKVT